MEYRYRRMSIADGGLTRFVEEWKHGVLPLRNAAGFETVSAWAADDGTFLWILGFEGPFEAADAAYYESPARLSMAPDPARFIESVDELTVTRIV